MLQQEFISFLMSCAYYPHVISNEKLILTIQYNLFLKSLLFHLLQITYCLKSNYILLVEQTFFESDRIKFLVRLKQIQRELPLFGCRNMKV
jgi:hypothetical protein